MKVTITKISEVKKNPNNPRVIKDDKFKKLVKSIKDFPKMLEIRPIVVNNDMVVLGGNMRLKACVEAGLAEVPIIKASELSEEEQKQFIIKDNVGFGEWDFEDLAINWDSDELEEWGLELSDFNISDEDFNEEFKLDDGEKEPFQQQTYTLADQQAEDIKEAIEKAKKTKEFEYLETFGNENSNGNALYLIVKQWVEQKK